MMKFMAEICDVMKTIGIGMIPTVLIGGLIVLIVKFLWIFSVTILLAFCYMIGKLIRDYRKKEIIL